MELKAKVIKTLGVERGVSQRSGKEWAKGTIVVEYGSGQYPKQVALQNFRSAEEFANLPLGREYTFLIDLDSHEFNGRYYTSVDCWKWEDATQHMPAPEQNTGVADPYAASGLGQQPKAQPAPQNADDLLF